MSKKGFSFLFCPYFWAVMVLLIAYLFLKHYNVSSSYLTLALIGLVLGVIGNALWVDELFFVNFALIGIVGAYVGIARYYITNIPQFPTWFLIIFSSYIIGSIISRFSRNVFGVGT